MPCLKTPFTVINKIGKIYIFIQWFFLYLHEISTSAEQNEENRRVNHFDIELSVPTQWFLWTVNKSPFFNEKYVQN